MTAFTRPRSSSRRWSLDDGKRVDGRGIDEIRPLAAEIDLLDRVHGSGMFTRGQTQVLTVTTLGPVSDSQILDGIDGEDTKRYMHHYNFPRTRSARPSPREAPDAARSATVLLQSVLFCPLSRALRSSRTACALSPRSFRPTARLRRLPSAARPFRLWAPACR